MIYLQELFKESERQKKLLRDIIENRLRELYSSNLTLSEDISKQQEFQKELIENLVDALIVFDFDMNILNINKEALKLLGYQRKTLPQVSMILRLVYTKIKNYFLMHILSPQKTLQVSFMFNFVNRNKELKYVTIKARLLKDSKDKPYAYQTIIRDITQQHLVEQKLIEQQKLLKIESSISNKLLKNPNIFNNGHDIVKIIADYLGTDDCVFYAVIEDKLIQIAAFNQDLNKKNNTDPFEVNFGEGIVGGVALRKKGIIINDTSKHPDYIVDDQKRLSEITAPIILDNELIAIIDAEHPKKNYFNAGQLDFLSRISSLISITLKKNIVELEKSKREQELDKTRDRLQLIFESSSDAKAIETIDGYIEQISHAFLKLFNIPISEISNLVGTDCVSARNMLKDMFVDEQIFAQRIEEIVTKGQEVLDEMLELKDGRILSRDYNPIFRDGAIIAHLWTYKDVTLIVNYDKSLKFQTKKYKSIIENMNLGLMEVDANETILNINNAFIKMCGYSKRELVGFKARDVLLDQEQRQYMEKMVSSRKDGTKDLYEMEIRTKSGEKRYWLISGGPNANINGEIIGSIGIHLRYHRIKNVKYKGRFID